MAIARAPREHQPRVPDVEICAAEDIAEIAYVARHPNAGYDSENCVNIIRAHRLVRQGFLRRVLHSEQIRGERRFYWWRFEVTDKGAQFLKSASRDHSQGTATEEK